MLKPLLIALLAGNAGLALWGYVASARGPQLRLGDGTQAQSGTGSQWPERIVLVPVPASAATPAPASLRAAAPAAPAAPVAPAAAEGGGSASGPVCLEAGPYGEGARATVDGRIAALGLPGLDSLRWVPRETAGWWVAMGPFAEPAQRAKQAELRKLGLAAEAQTQGGDRWLVLARASEAAAAERALQALKPRGVRTARVIEARGAAGWMLRLPQATAAQRQALGAARLPGPGFGACAG